MPRYHYKARTAEGRSVEGDLDSPDEKSLDAELQRQGMVLLEAGKGGAPARRTAGRNLSMAQTDLIFFTMELSTSYGAGLPLLGTLEDMSETAETPAVRALAAGLAEHVKGGASLAEALSAFPKAFPNLFVELVGAAERTGKLEEIFKDLVRFLEWQKEVKGQIVSATVYPASLFGAVVMLALVLTLFVFPRFLSTFAAMGGELPMPTQILLGINEVVQHQWPVLLGAAVGLPTGYMVLRRLPPVRWRIDYAKVKAPVFGPLITKVLMSRFSHNLGMMISSGLDFGSSLALCERLMGNVVLANVVAEAKSAVEQGRPLSDAMSRGGFVPSLVRRMLKLGETTGELEKSLEAVSTYYDKEVPRAIKRMFGVVEPLLLMFMAGMVLFMASAVLLPLYSMLGKMGQG